MKNIPYGRQSIDRSDIKAVVDVLKSDWLTQGPMIEKFETELAKYCGAKYAVCVSSGTAALHLACLTTGLKKGDEAITTPITFLATANSIIYTGAKPVFADINYDTINIDPIQIRAKISKNTKAVLPVHFAGLPCDMPEIYNIAKENNLTVIEDACHALGAEYKYKNNWYKVGSCKHSDMTVFSFHPVKHITTGEGGAVTTNNKILYNKLRSLRSHGIYKDKRTAKKGPWYYEMRELGYNYRMTDFQAVLGYSQLKKLNKFIKKRQRIVVVYNKAFKNMPFINIPLKSEKKRSSYHLYILKIDFKKLKISRYKFMEFLRKKGILSQVHYIPLYRQPFYKTMGYSMKNAVKANKYYSSCLSFPIFFDLKLKQQKYIIKQIKTIIGVI